MLNNAVKSHPRQKQQTALDYLLGASATAEIFLIENIKMPQAVSKKVKRRKKRKDIFRKENVESNQNFVLKRGFDFFTKSPRAQ